MKKLILSICMLSVMSITIDAQQSEFPKLTGPYLGQKPPGMTPEIFAPGVVSRQLSMHSATIFSPDGNEMYWTVMKDPEPIRIYFRVEKAKPVEDADGHVYRTVKIGNQIWMAENLKTTRYNNGQPIPHVTDNSAWGVLRAPAYCYYNNEETNLGAYGALYNWHAVSSGKLAPKGWHVPTDAEWTTLAAYLGGEGVAGGKMKEAGFAYWLAPNAGASNSSAFSALPGGGRDDDGEFSGLTCFANFWSSTESSPSNAWRRHLVYDDRNARRDNFGKMMGFSVRCIKDSSSPESSTSVGIRK